MVIRSLKILAGMLFTVILLAGSLVFGLDRGNWTRAFDAGLDNRVEEVFAYQNRVASAVTRGLLDDDVNSARRTAWLENLEESLSMACGPIQSAGYRTIQGENLGVYHRLQALTALSGCEVTAAKVEYDLWIAHRSSARRYLRDGQLLASNPAALGTATQAIVTAF